jgi:ribosomal protein L36
MVSGRFGSKVKGGNGVTLITCKCGRTFDFNEKYLGKKVGKARCPSCWLVYRKHVPRVIGDGPRRGNRGYRYEN